MSKKTKTTASEASILKWHLAVINDELVDDEGYPMVMGDTAKSNSSRAVERILLARDERTKKYLPRKDVQKTLASLASLVRDRLLQAAQQGLMERDDVEAILTELSSESTRLFSKMVDDE